jgi:hypothetical protein
LIVIVIPEGGALDAGQPPDVGIPDEPPVATPDELPPEDDIAPVDEPPLDGLPVEEPEREPADADDDPEVNPVPLLPTSVPVLALASNSGRCVLAAISCPWCS